MITGMSDFWQGLLSGVSASVLVSVAALVLEHRRHRRELTEERAKTTYPDVLKAYTAFATQMREAALWHARFEDTHGTAWVDQPQPPDGDGPPREEPELERLLADLRLLDDGALYQSARAYLDEHYEVHWGPADGRFRRTTDLTGRETEFIRAAQKRLGLTGADG